MNFASTLVVFTIIMVVGWVFYSIVALQTKRLVGYSKYLKPTSIALFWLLIILTLLGYFLIFVTFTGSGGSIGEQGGPQTFTF